MSEILVFFKEHWGLISTVVAFFVGVNLKIIDSKKKLKEIDFQINENYRKAFEISSNMIESVKQDFEDRLRYLKAYSEELEEINIRLRNLVEKQKKYLEIYKKKYGRLEEV